MIVEDTRILGRLPESHIQPLLHLRSSTVESPVGVRHGDHYDTLRDGGNSNNSRVERAGTTSTGLSKTRSWSLERRTGLCPKEGKETEENREVIVLTSVTRDFHWGILTDGEQRDPLSEPTRRGRGTRGGTLSGGFRTSQGPGLELV